MGLTPKVVQYTFTVPESLSGARLDYALAQLLQDYSRSRLQQWIKAKQVLVDGEALPAKSKVFAGQIISVNAFIEEEIPWQAQDIDLNICYEDDDILVINKPPGLIVHPGAGNPDKTLVNALLHHAPTLAQVPRAGIVHRLDKDTSGLLVVAKNLTAHKVLVEQLQARKVKREYLALVNGTLISGGTIEASIARHPSIRTRMAVVEDGKEAITHYWVKQRFTAHTLLKILLETGRTHQIRVHLAFIDYPIVGDPVYGGRFKLPAGCSDEVKTQLQNFKRQALHAFRLSLDHPISKIHLEWEAPIPDDLQQLLDVLETNDK